MHAERAWDINSDLEKFKSRQEKTLI